MKRFKTFLLVFVMAFAISFFFYSNQNDCNQASAAPTSNEVNSTNFRSFDMEYNLFHVLLVLENEVANENDTFFDKDFFNSGYTTCSPVSADGIAIKNDLASHELNLTTGTLSPYTCLQSLTSSDKITSVSGLRYLILSNVTTLNLSDNLIERISSTDLSSLTSLDDLYINNNKLTSFNIGSELYGLIVNLYLRDNQLDYIDLSHLAANAHVDLANNLIENVTDVVLSTNLLSYIDLSFNNITNIENLSTLTTYFGHTPLLFVQGLNKEQFNAGDKISVISGNEAINLVGHVKYFAGDGEETASSYYVDSTDITFTTGASGLENLILPAGKLSVSFTYDTGLSSIPADDLNYFVSKYVPSRMPAPNYVAESDGAVITELSSYKPIEFTFSLNLDNNVPNRTNILEDATLFSGKSGTETETNLVKLDSYGSYLVKAYYNFDSIKGEELFLYANYSKETNILLGIIILVSLIVLCGCAYLVVRWIKDGAVVAPLTDKEIARARRREERRTGRDDKDYTYIDSLYGNGRNLVDYQEDTNDDEVDLSKDSNEEKNNSYNGYQENEDEIEQQQDEEESGEETDLYNEEDPFQNNGEDDEDE